MAGNRYELMSPSPDSSFTGSYQTGQRGYPTPTLDRSASFRDGACYSSAKANSRVSPNLSGEVPTLSQCLLLEPIVMSDPKYARPGDLRRILGHSVGSSSEDNSFTSSHLKNSPPVAVDEIKRLRASVAETCVKARYALLPKTLPSPLISGRAKKLDEHLNKLNKYVEVVSSKKQQQRNELLPNDRAGGSVLKIGSQMQRNSSEAGTQKFDDRSKGSLNKRLRTSVAEMRAECRNNGLPRQPLMVTKERDLVKDNNVDSDMVEEKIRRLPAGGEGWDKKMKRKRSVGAVFSRSVDNDGEQKRTIHQKLCSEPSLQSSDSGHGFRSGASVGNNKLDPTSSPVGSSIRTTSKSEQEKSILSRDLSAGPIKERPLGKVNVKLNNREDNHGNCPSPIVKGKAARAPRSGSLVSASSAANISRLPGTLESWEQSQVLNRTPSISGSNNRKRTMPAGSSSPPITQWVGQRPQKICRTRRTNLIPVSNHDEVQMQSEGCSPSDFGPRLSTSGINTSLLSKTAANGTQNIRVKPENLPSPARLSESEESGAGEHKIKEKSLGSGDVEERAAGQSVPLPSIPIKKNKVMVKEDIGDGVRRQGRTGRVSPFSRASVSPTREKVDSASPSKPLRNARSGSEKNGSKSGRPLKKLSDRKGFSRLGHMANGGSPDFSGESEDDREELLAAANLACNSSFNACSNTFWKTIEALFASIGEDEKSYLSEQLKFAEESHANPPQNCSIDNKAEVHLADPDHEEMKGDGSLSHGGGRGMKNGSQLKDYSESMGYTEPFQSSYIFGASDQLKKSEIVTPLYQRLLSAFIVEDEIEESEETGFGRSPASNTDSCLLIGTENKHMDKMGLCEPIFGVQGRENGNAHMIFSCNGNANLDRSSSGHDLLFNGELLQRAGGYVHSEVEVFVRLSRYDYVQQNVHTSNCGISHFDSLYEKMPLEGKLMIELRSIDVSVEAMPALDDKEEVFNQEILQLEKSHEQIENKKKTSLEKLNKAIQEGMNSGRRDPEQVAVDKLIELAYKKYLATRGSFASKHGIPKVSKQVASSFIKRTLARCRKFEDSGASCFSEPALKEIVYAAPPRFDGAQLLAGINQPVANDGNSFDAFESSIHQSDQAFAKNGPISNRGKKKEVLLDDVGGAVFRASSGLGILGGAKGKRSDRDRDASVKNSGKAGRSAMGGSKGDRKNKSKPKQKTAQLSTSGNGFINNSVYPSASGSGESGNNGVSQKKDVRFMSSGNAPPISSKDTKDSVDFASLPLNDIDGIEELGVDSEIGAPQDINSWFNFEVDGLQDHDSVGLEIPMDDLSELNMF